MKGLRILGVGRANQFSPNHVGNDAAIFNAVADCLRREGCEVALCDEETFVSSQLEAPVIFDMARHAAAVARLKMLEEQGATVVNSGRGIENCTRERMTRLLLEGNVPHPRSLIVETNVSEFPLFEGDTFKPCWIKRGDFHAIHREDVSYVRTAEEGLSLLGEYALRGIERAVVNEHLAGDLVKFYGVAGTPFFYWFYPYDLHHSKFGLEQINGLSRGLPFDEAEMRAICQRAAEVLDVRVYGGDCIVSEDGSIRIIDFNDWPSFAPCRDAAAPHIAHLIIDEATNRP